MEVLSAIMWCWFQGHAAAAAIAVDADVGAQLLHPWISCTIRSGEHLIGCHCLMPAGASMYSC
jgi:hypothetical protein